MRSRFSDPSGPLASHMAAFLEHKRALNRKYHVEAGVLQLLDRHLNEVGITTISEITPEILDAFFLGRPRDRPRSFNHLVGVVGRLFEWMVAHEVINRSPVTTPMRRGGRTRLPCIFDLPTAQRLIDLAAGLLTTNELPCAADLPAAIFSLLFGLGLRVGEATRLRCRDVDQERQHSDHPRDKILEVTAHPDGATTGLSALRLHGHPEGAGRKAVTQRSGVSFVDGRPVDPGTISHTFHVLVTKLGLVIAEGTRPPTVHHLRHSFAVGRLLRWNRDDDNPATKLMKLSTFMGYVDPTSTAVYLTVTADLLDAAARRFERSAAPLSNGGPE